VKDHPELATFLADHPEIARDWEAYPTVAMTDVRRYDNLTAAQSLSNARDLRTTIDSFDDFLRDHPVIEGQIERHPALATEVSYIDAHPELKAYLQANPDVAAELKDNPEFLTMVADSLKPAPRVEKKEDLKPKVAVK